MPKEKTGTNKKNGFILAMFYIGLLGLSTIWFGAYLSGRENSTEAVVMAPSPLPARPDASAVNEIVPIGTGYQLSNPRHTAVFSSNGIHFMPNDGPTWEWQLDYVGSAKGEAATAVSLTATTPQNNQANIIAYLRGAIIEQYIAHYQNVEQQFILPQPLALNKADLLLTGTVNSTGNFVETTNGWLWITDEGVVSLGDVTVFDANGANIPATLTVTATETQIWVDGTALASADYPVTIDPTIGSSDFRISDAGSDSNALTDAFTPAVAYNSTDNEYLVVWAADNADGIVEIYGQRINAATGVEVGNNDFRISDMGGTDSNAAFSAQRPDVTYNSSNNEYLVVWHGDDDTGSLVDEEFEIYGQRIYGDLSDGDEAGNNDFRISDMGSTDGDEVYDAWNTAVTYNNTNNEYLVVWQGDDTTDNAVEIYAQRIYGNRATGDEVGNNDFRISDMGSTDSSTAFRGERPAVAYNSSSNQYLVVWQGDDDTSPLVDDEYEIFGQRVYGNRATGDEINSDFRISDMGTNGDTDYGASEPAVVYNSSATNEYLIVWSGDDDTSPLVDGELEIFGQRLSAGGVEQGGDFRISDMGDNGDTSFKAFAPSVMYNTDDDSYLVVWRGDDNQDFGGGMLADNEHEIFGEWLDASTGIGVSDNDFRISDMGSSDGDTSFIADRPDVVYNSSNDHAMVVWQGDDDDALIDNEFEIYGERLQQETCDTATTVDLTVTTTESIEPVVAGSGSGNLTYVVTVTNNGPDTACAVEVNNVITTPSGVTVDSITPSGSTGYAANTWTILNMASGNSETLTIVLTVDISASAGTNVISSSASVTATNDTISNPEDDSDIEATSIESAPDSFSISDVAADEGNNGSKTFAFTISRTTNYADSSVQYQTANDTATAGEDYTAVSLTTVNFSAGGTLSKNVNITVSGDTTVELDETFFVNLANPSGGVIDDGQGEGTIKNDDSATLSIDDVTLTEGDFGMTSFDFAVTLSGSVDSGVDVNFAAVDDTALVADNDYTDDIGTVSFAGTTGEVEIISIDVTGDTTVEPDEQFFVNLSGIAANGRNVTLADNQAIGAIINDDGATVDFNVDMSAIDEGDGTATVEVTLSNSSNFTVTVNYALSDGTATDGADYSNVPGSLTFAPGETSQSFPVPILEDGIDEVDETIILTLSNATNAALGSSNNPSTLVILDDDGVPDVNFSSFNYTVDEAVVSATITVTLGNASGQPVMVDYASIDGSAKAGFDYTAVAGTLAIPAGTISTTFTVLIINDGIYEATESLMLALSNPVNISIGLVQTATLSLLDNESAPEVGFDISDPSFDESVGTVVVTATLSTISGFDVMVDYESSDDLATAGEDYTAVNSTLTIPAGQPFASFTLPIIDDALDEPDETLLLTLSNPIGATLDLGRNESTVVITDNDDPPTISFDAATFTVDESAGNAIVTVTLSGASGKEITVDYASSDGSALAGVDYTAVADTLIIPAGATNGTFTIPILDDKEWEYAETINLTLSSAVSATLTAPTTAVLTILISDNNIYLPIIMNNYALAPDLVVDSISVTTNDVEIVIVNQGGTAVTESFWVDLYINPSPVPTAVNQVWEALSAQGIAWGVEDLSDLVPGGSLTLTLNHAAYVPSRTNFSGLFTTGMNIYVQVDSANTSTNYGGVLENHEIIGATYNNINSVTVALSSNN